MSADSPRAIARFAERLGLRFRFLSDDDGRVASAYGVIKSGTKGPSARRVTFLIDPEGGGGRDLGGSQAGRGHADLTLGLPRG